MNRRGLFGAAAGTLAGGRRVGQSLLEGIIRQNEAEEVPTPIGGQTSSWVDYPNQPAPPSPPDLDLPSTWVQVLRDRVLRDEVESGLYYQHREIPLRDVPPYLGELRSFSINAKITFFRQDLVTRGLQVRQRMS